MAHEDEKDGLSVTAMVIAVMLLITWFCWALGASSYFGSLFEVAAPEPGSGRFGGRSRGLALIIGTVISFLLNSVRLNHAPAIIGHVFANERWIIITFLVLMGTAVLFGFWVKKLEAELAGPKPKKNRRKRAGQRRKRPHRAE
jgi:phosphotransferase system  glucose/maltose/N-acetylglucosamine-specific IIC component